MPKNKFDVGDRVRIRTDKKDVIPRLAGRIGVIDHPPFPPPESVYDYVVEIDDSRHDERKFYYFKEDELAYA